MIRFLYFFIVFSFFSIFADGTNKTVYLGKFAAYNSAKDPQVEDLIFLNLKKELTDSGYTVREGEADLSGTPIEEKSLEKNSHSFLIDGYYRKDKFHNLNLYIQIYDASTGNDKSTF